MSGAAAHLRNTTRSLIRETVFAAVCAITLLPGCESQDQRTGAKEAARKEQVRRIKEERHQMVTDISRPHNADIDWSSRPFVWTADVQDRLMRADRRPIAGVAKFIDIERIAGMYPIRLRYYGDINSSTALVEFFLRTTRLELPKTDWPRDGEDAAEDMATDYIFVARIERVRRDDISIGGEAYRRWIAEGECLEAPVPLTRKTK